MLRLRAAGLAGLVLALALGLAAGAWSRDAGTRSPGGSTEIPLPGLSIADASAAEGDTGTNTLSFQVTLASSSRTPASVSYSTADGSAAAPSDYQATSGTLQFAPGATSKTIEVPIVGDTSVEPDETFSVNLSNAVGAQIVDGSGTGTIQNDDQPPAAPPPPPPKVKCTCKKVTLKLAGWNAHGPTRLTGGVSGKKEAAEFWDFVVKTRLECRKGDIADCEGFAKTDSPERFPPFATQKPRKFRCRGKKCNSTQVFRLEVRIRITREQILEARDRWKQSKKPLKKKLKIRAGCRGNKGTVKTFTLVFTNGNFFSAPLSDQNGDRKADGR